MILKEELAQFEKNSNNDLKYQQTGPDRVQVLNNLNEKIAEINLQYTREGIYGDRAGSPGRIPAARCAGGTLGGVATARRREPHRCVTRGRIRTPRCADQSHGRRGAGARTPEAR